MKLSVDAFTCVCLALALSACDGASISGNRAIRVPLESSDAERLRSTDLPFRLEEARFKVNGDLVASRVTVSDESFSFLFFYLKNDGLFIVSHRSFEPAQATGSIGGKILTFSANGMSIEIENESIPLMGDHLRRQAWAWHIPDFVMFESPDRSPDSVIGLADHFWQIPWFDTYQEDRSTDRR